jgi:hypothetical protein
MQSVPYWIVNAFVKKIVSINENMQIYKEKLQLSF